MPIATPQGTLDFKSVDKVTFVGASSNTVIDTTTGSLGVGVGVGGPTSNLHVVGDALITGNVSDLNVVSNVNMLHTSNTASIKLNSNVVAEFPRSKKLIKYPRVALTANSSGGYVSSASTALNSTLEAWYVFDTVIPEGSTVSRWRSANSVYTNNSAGSPAIVGTAAQLSASSGTPSGEYILVTLPEKMCLKRYSWSGMTTQGPKDGEIWGSNDGSSWSHVHTFTDGNSGWVSAGSSTSDYGNYPDHRDVGEGNVAFYSRYAFITTKLAGGDIAASMRDLQYFGTPEYDPEAHGTDVTVKSYPNVPNTDWLEVYYDAKNYTSGLVQDLSTNSLNGTLTNGASYNNSDGIDKFVFDGSNDYISGSIPSTFTGNQTYTFSSWIKPDSHPSGFIGVFGIGTNSTHDSIGLFLDGGNIIHLTYGNNLTTTAYATIGEWVHITGTYDGTGRTVFVNGKLVGTDSYSSLTLTGTTSRFGSNLAGGQNFNGSIANFRLFNRALTSDEIYQLYAYQKEDFGHGDLSMTLKAGRLGIGTSEPRAALDVRGRIMREYNPGEIIETIQTRADGQNVRVLSGTYSIQNVTSLQDVTTSHTIVTGSSISYKPPPGTTRVIYEFYVYVRLKDPDVLIHFAGRLAGTQVSHTRSTFRSRDYEQQWVYNNMTITIGDVGSDNLANGKLASWTTNKTIDFTCRDYASNHEAYLHGPEHWDGGSTSIKITPFIKITAIA